MHFSIVSYDFEAKAFAEPRRPDANGFSQRIEDGFKALNLYCTVYDSHMPKLEAAKIVDEGGVGDLLLEAYKEIRVKPADPRADLIEGFSSCCVSNFVVRTKEGTPVAFGRLHYKPDWLDGYFAAAATHKNYRRQGIFRLLIATSILSMHIITIEDEFEADEFMVRFGVDKGLDQTAGLIRLAESLKFEGEDAEDEVNFIRFFDTNEIEEDAEAFFSA